MDSLDSFPVTTLCPITRKVGRLFRLLLSAVETKIYIEEPFRPRTEGERSLSAGDVDACTG